MKEKINKEIPPIQHEDSNYLVKEPSKKLLSRSIMVASELVGCVLVSGYLGYILDKYFDISPLLLVLFIIIGSIAAMRNVYKYLKD